MSGYWEILSSKNHNFRYYEKSMTSNLNGNDTFYQNAFSGTFASGQYFLDNNQLLQLNYQPVFEDPECKKQKSPEDQADPEAKRLKATDSREFGYFGAPPPQSLGSNSPPSSNESSSPNYPLNQQYPFNFTDYNNQKPFPTIIQTTVIDDLNRIDNVYIKKSKRDPIAEYDAELAESIEFELGLKKQNGPRKNSWGNLSYAELITRAIESSAEQRLTLSQIYDWIIKYVPYFKEKFDRTSSAGWKNSIRHNLSLHNRFIRVQNESSGKSSWWMINPDVSKYAINSSGQDDLIMDNCKDKTDKTKTDETKMKKSRRNPAEAQFDDKAKKTKPKCVKKPKNAKKPEAKAEKLDISAVDSPVSPSNFSLSNNILRTALQKPSNTPPTPTATPSVTYRSYTGDFYQNSMPYPSSNLADYSYQNNGLNKSSQYYNYQCLSNNQSYSKGYAMPQMNNSNLYFNQSYQKAPNVSSPVSTASTTSTASTSSYDLSNRLNKTGQQSLPMTPSSINNSVMNTTAVAAYDDFNDLFKSQTNNSAGQTSSYSVYQTNQMTNVTNSAPIGCFYGN